MLRFKVVKDPDLWATIQSMGNFEDNYKNGEIWYFNGELYYLSHLELSPEALQEIVSMNEGPINI